MTRYLDLFLSETREHLGHGEERVEDIARGERGGPVHDLFRHVHSVKGMAASMGFGHITAFAHRLEDVLDRLRDECIEPDEAMLDLVRRGLDHIAAQVDAVESGGPALPPDAALLGRLQELLDASGDAAPPPQPDAAPPATAGAAAKGDGRPVFRLEVRYAAAAELPAARALVLLARLESLGSVLDLDPPRDRIRSDTFAGCLRLRLATAEPLATLRSRLERLPDVASATVAPETEETRAPEGTAAPAAVPSTIRVKTEHLDRLLEVVGELIVHRSLLRGRLPEELPPAASEELDAVSSLVADLHDTVLAMRMLPFETVAHRVARGVRDLARDLGKKVHFEIRGREVGLDRSLLEELLDPLEHVLRNALDHGLEAPEERRRAGKPETGDLRLSIERRGDTVHLAVEDDGRGMDPEVLRKTALARGIADEETLASMAEDDLLMLVTRPGFSTTDRATLVSGRGVGMDVVRTRIEGLGGRLALRSVRGQGTGVHLTVPVTISLVRSLLVEVAGQTFAVPASTVQRTVELEASAVQVRRDRAHIVVDGEAIPLHDLAGLLGMGSPGEPAAARRPCFLFHDGKRRACVLVDRIVGLREMVIKPLGSPLELVPHMSGATILEDGRVALILDLAHLATG